MRTILPEQENPALREKAREIPIEDIKSERIQSLINELQKLLSKEEYGVAIAASQVGEPLKLFVVSGRALARAAYLEAQEKLNDSQDGEGAKDEAEESEEEKYEPWPDQIYINPELVKVSRAKKDKHEGCLSVRGKWGMVPRAEKASVRAYDEHGVRFTRGASGFLAHIFQHEMDHLEGVLYTDKATELFDDAEQHHEQPEQPKD